MDNITREVKFSGSNGDELAQSFNESVKKPLVLLKVEMALLKSILQEIFL